MRAVRQVAAYRAVVVLLWGLAAYATVVCRGLFWDGSSFLANILDHGGFHDFYVARAHVDWVTQAPVLLLSEFGVRDTRLLSMAYSASLFALPAALYHLALARVRHDAVLLGIVIAAVAVVYLPTSFFIIGEYNATFAAVTAGMAVTMTSRESRLGDASLLCVLGVFCVRSYEAMVWLGPLLAAAIVWSRRKDRDPATKILAGIAALAFIAAAVVAAATIADYWSHPHFIKVRLMSFDFWQNLQFAIPLAGLAVSTVVGLARPAWLEGRGPLIVMGIATAVLASTPWWRLLHEHSILYPPAHYLAREAAGLLLALLLACMWLHVAWPAAGGLATPRRGHDGAPHRRRHSRRGADGTVVRLPRPPAQPGRQPAGHHSRRRPATARLAGQAVRPGLVAARHERDREPHARPRFRAGRQRLSEQPAVRSGLRDAAAPKRLRLGTVRIMPDRGPPGPLMAGSAPLRGASSCPHHDL